LYGKDIRMKLEEMIIHTKKNDTYKQHVKELNKELSDRRKALKGKLSQKKISKVHALRSYEHAADNLIQKKIEDPRLLDETSSFMNDIIKFIHYASKRMERYFKSTININVSQDMFPQLAGAMLGQMIQQTSKANILMVKELIRKKIIEKTSPQIIAALEAIEKDPKSFFEKGIYPKLPLRDIEHFILEFSKSSTFKPLIQDINRSLERINNLLLKNKYMSKVRDKTPITL
jgi:cell fate (sporulation/competence/biofilm development) regulator YmcA (YheA/YmcA/DUF963 family)